MCMYMYVYVYMKVYTLGISGLQHPSIRNQQVIEDATFGKYVTQHTMYVYIVTL